MQFLKTILMTVLFFCAKFPTRQKVDTNILHFGLTQTLSQTSPVLHVCSTSLLKTPWEMDKLLVMSNFSFSHSIFYQFEELFAIFIKFENVICTFFQFEPVPNIAVNPSYVL